MPAGQWGPHRGFPDRLVPIEYTKPNAGAGGDLYIRWRRGFMRVFRHVVASIVPTQKSVPRSSCNLRTVAIGALCHLALQTGLSKSCISEQPEIYGMLAGSSKMPLWGDNNE